MAIETTNNSAEIPANYTHLFEMGDRVAESQRLEIEEIILKVCDKDRKNQLGRKVAHLNARLLNQNAQEVATQGKVSALRQTLGLYLDGASVACNVAAAVLGGQAAGLVPGGLMALAEAFNRTGAYRNSVRDANMTVFEHSYQRNRDIVGDHSQQMQAAEKELDQNAGMVDRIIQNSRRQQESVNG